MRVFAKHFLFIVNDCCVIKFNKKVYVLPEGIRTRKLSGWLQPLTSLNKMMVLSKRIEVVATKEHRESILPVRHQQFLAVTPSKVGGGRASKDTAWGQRKQVEGRSHHAFVSLCSHLEISHLFAWMVTIKSSLFFHDLNKMFSKQNFMMHPPSYFLPS